MLHLLAINDFSSTPKYLQIYNLVIEGIQTKKILPGDKLPSIFEVLTYFDVSKATVERAYELLKENKVVDSTRGKGYYIRDAKINLPKRIFLLFNKLSAHKKLIYDGFVDELGTDVLVDFFIYNNDFIFFRKLLFDHVKTHNYSNYVIIAHFFEGSEEAVELINSLPKHKLLILDKFIEGVTGRYSAVYQDFEDDLFNALTDALPQLRKYSTLNIIFSDYTYQPTAILNGFARFCAVYGFESQVISKVDSMHINLDHAYINLMEEDLVALIKRIKDTQFLIGQQVGILSYNETILKELLLDGISVISTDFVQMGRRAAQLVMGNKVELVRNPFRYIMRNSL